MSSTVWASQSGATQEAKPKRPFSSEASLQDFHRALDDEDDDEDDEGAEPELSLKLAENERVLISFDSPSPLNPPIKQSEYLCALRIMHPP